MYFFVLFFQGSELIIERKKVQKLSVEGYGAFYIDRMVAIPDSRLLVATRRRHVIYELGRSFNETKMMYFSDRPTNMCYIGEDEAELAVCFLKLPQIALVSKSGHITEIRTHIKECISITYHDNKLYFLDGRGVLYKYDTIKKNISIVTVIWEIFVPFPYIPLTNIAVSTNGKMIYVCNYSELFTVYQDNVKSKLHLENKLMDICVMDDGTILVCSKRCLYQIDQYGKNVLCTTPIQIGGLACAMCYDKVKSELLIADEAGHIHVYDIRKKR